MDKIKEYKTKLMKISLVREPSTMQKVKISSSLTTANYIKGIYEECFNDSFDILLMMIS